MLGTFLEASGKYIGDSAGNSSNDDGDSGHHGDGNYDKMVLR